MSAAVTILTVAGVLGCALNGGVLFAFSWFVMPALGRLAPQRGVETMQAINVAAVKPAFMTALFGTALVCLGLLAAALASLGDHDPDDGTSPAAWERYLRSWTRANHVRAAAALVAAALLAGALLAG